MATLITGEVKIHPTTNEEYIIVIWEDERGKFPVWYYTDGSVSVFFDYRDSVAPTLTKKQLEQILSQSSQRRQKS